MLYNDVYKKEKTRRRATEQEGGPGTGVMGGSANIVKGIVGLSGFGGKEAL